MFHSIAFKIVFSIMSQNKRIRAENGTIYSNIGNNTIGEQIRKNKQELLTLLNSIPIKTLKQLYELYEERAGIIEYDGGYCEEVAEKLALQEVLALINSNNTFISTGIVLSYKDNPKKPPPYCVPNKILKGIDIESPKVKKIINEVKNEQATGT